MAVEPNADIVGNSPSFAPPGVSVETGDETQAVKARTAEEEARRAYYVDLYGEEAQIAWEADSTTHATVSRLNEEYKIGGERNTSAPVDSAYTGSASCFKGNDPYAALKNKDK